MILSDSSLKRPVAMTVFIIALVVLGAYSFLGLGMDFMPEIDVPYVTIVTLYPGAGPEEVETLVTDKIEEAISEVTGIEKTKSASMENVSQIVIEFSMEIDVNDAAAEVREKVDMVINDLPDEVEKPIIQKLDVNAKAVATLALVGNRGLDELYELADDRIRDQLSKVPGLASLEIFGGWIREIQILVNPESLAAHNLTLNHVIAALGQDNLDMPSGRITEDQTEFSVRMEGEFERVEEIEAFQLTTPDGTLIPLSAVATVSDAFEEQRDFASYNGTHCVGLELKKQADANLVAVVDGIIEQVDTINKTLPEGVSLVVVNEGSRFVRASVSDVTSSILIGIALTSILLLIFLHDFRQTIIAAVSMPVSVITTFMLINFANFNLNVMTLTALALSIGILVTNAIVVIENVFRHFKMGKSALQAAKDGTSEIATAVFASTLTNIVVFLPIAFMSGIVGRIFVQFAVTMAFATVISLFVSFTLVPILSSKLMRPQDEERRGLMARFSAAFNSGFGKMENGYGKLVGWALRHRLAVVLIAVIVFAVAIYFARNIGMDLMQNVDQSDLSINVEMAPGTTIEETKKAFRRLEDLVDEHHSDVVLAKMIRIGTIDTVAGSQDGVHLGSMLLVLQPKEKRSKRVEAIGDEIREYVNVIPGANITVTVPSPIGGTSYPVQLQMTGPDLEQLSNYVDELLATNVEGMIEATSSWKPGKPEVRIAPDRLKMRDYGLTSSQLAMTLRAAIAGIVSSEFRVGQNEYDIRVKLDESEASYIEQIEQLDVMLPSGKVVQLQDIADVEITTGPVDISHFNKQRAVVLSSDTTGRALGSIVADLEKEIEKLNLPPDYSYQFVGFVEMMGDSFAEMAGVLLLAIVLTYLVLCGILESYLQPISILITLPLAAVGIIGTLLITGQNMSIFAMMATIMLVGIVVNNAILIIDYANVLLAQGSSRTEALVAACSVKLRPIVMTTLATIFGMLPLVISTATGSEMRMPMGLVTIGGLLVSAVMALLIIPVVYTLFDDLRGGRKQRER